MRKKGTDMAIPPRQKTISDITVPFQFRNDFDDLGHVHVMISRHPQSQNIYLYASNRENPNAKFPLCRAGRGDTYIRLVPGTIFSIERHNPKKPFRYSLIIESRYTDSSFSAHRLISGQLESEMKLRFINSI